MTIRSAPRSPSESWDAATLVTRAAAGDAGIALLDDAWDELVRSSPRPNPALSAAWLRRLAAWEPGVPLIVTVEAAGRLVGGGAFGLRTPAGRLGPRVATWLGDERQWFSPDVLVAPTHRNASLAVVDAVLGAADVVAVSAEAHGPMASALADLVAWTRLTDRTSGWILRLPPPRLRYAKRRAEYEQRRAGRRGARISVAVAETRPEVEDALERLFDLHRQRWRDRGGEVVRFSTTEAHRAWYRALVSVFAERRDVHVCEVREDGRVVASALSFLSARGSIFHTTAVGPGDHLREPGHVALLVSAEAAAAAGAEVMDLGWGAGAPGTPKARLGPDEVPIVRLLAASSPRTQLLVEQFDAGVRGLERIRAARPLAKIQRAMRAS